MIKKVVNKRYAKGKGNYEEVISTIERKGKCPFCPGNFIYHKKPILKKYKGWSITLNQWPYENTKYHFMAVPNKHKENFQELTEDDFKAMKFLINWTIKKFKIKGGGVNMRFGETNHTGATVCHLHFHLIVPKLNDQKIAKTVYFPIG